MSDSTALKWRKNRENSFDKSLLCVDLLLSEYFTCQATRVRSKYRTRHSESKLPIHYRVIVRFSPGQNKGITYSWSWSGTLPSSTRRGTLFFTYCSLFFVKAKQVFSLLLRAISFKYGSDNTVTSSTGRRPQVTPVNILTAILLTR